MPTAPATPPFPALPPLLATTEFRLAAACAIWPSTSMSRATIRRCLDEPLDWPFFVHLVARHRIGGLVAHALSKREIGDNSRVPAEIAADLAEQKRDGVRLALTQLAEATRLDALFTQAGIETAFLKGQSLAALAYGDRGIGLRHSRDIDVLVAPTAVDAALAILTAAGYHPESPRHVRPRFRRARTMYHLTLVHQQSGLVVELHWRLTENPWLMPVDHGAATSHTVALPGGTRLRTLPGRELFVYLCVHGARHSWFRLKWLADIAALASRMDETELNAVLALARSRGLWRPVAQGLVLASRVLGLALPGDLTMRLADGAAMRFLVRVAATALADPSMQDDESGAPAAVVVSHYLLRGGPRYWLAELMGDMISRQDWETVPLPERLAFLYPALRLPMWLWRRFLRPHIVQPEKR